MRFDDDATKPSSDAPAGSARARRRAARPWSNPAPAERPATGSAEDDRWKAAAAAPRPPSTPLLSQAPPSEADLGPIATQLAAVQAQLTALQAAVAEPPPAPDASLVTGSELAAAIDGLGTALGGGMATLLTEHRNLLARDVSAAADRILEEVATRMRAAATQTIDGVEERIRHLVTRSVGDLTEQLELRLDKLQSDVTGLRTVMLEIPDQTSVTERLDRLSEVVTTSRGRDGRISPAVAASIERSVAEPLEALEESINAVAAAVRELFDERLPEDLVETLAGAVADDGRGGIDADAIEALTKEMTALRRRISLRTGGDDLAVAPARPEPPDPPPPPAPVVQIDADEAGPADEPIPVEAPEADPARATRATKATKVTGRRGRRSISD